MHRSIGTSPFKLLFGVNANLKEDSEIQSIIADECMRDFQEKRNAIREEAAKNIAKVQAENKRTYNKRRKEPIVYKISDLVAIKRTQTGPGLNKFLGPYEIVKVLRNHRYLVRKVGEHEGPNQTSTAAEHMKPWVDHDLSSEEEDV